jgi:hypothetical protein
LTGFEAQIGVFQGDYTVFLVDLENENYAFRQQLLVDLQDLSFDERKNQLFLTLTHF